ncbi:MAG: hypothetical protein H0V88_11975 [Pyrinomonadaceae bacterium]|nr:hypothetical protein [Pyrinomonadaceae bacterium]
MVFEDTNAEPIIEKRRKEKNQRRRDEFSISSPSRNDNPPPPPNSSSSGLPVNSAAANSSPANPSNAAPERVRNAANELLGTWTLQVQSPDNQRLQLILTIKQDGSRFYGSIGDQTGQTPLNQINVQGNEFNFKLSGLQLEGQVFDFSLSGKAEGSNMKGNLNLTTQSGASFTLPMTGTRTGQ